MAQHRVGLELQPGARLLLRAEHDFEHPVGVEVHVAVVDGADDRSE